MLPSPSDPAEFLTIPAAKRQYNERLFAEVARRYDFVTRALSLGRDQAWKRTLLQALPEHLSAAPVSSAGVCLDLACGTGDVAFALARRYPPATIHGLDLTPEMLAIAQHRNCYSNVRLVLGDIHDLPFPAASIDLVTGSYALRNAPSLSVALSEIHRVLRPGGTAAFLDFSKSPSRLMQRISYLVLLLWGSFWGQVLHRQPSVYAYIASSLWHFPDRLQLRQAFSSVGLELLTTRRFFFGMLEMVVVIKPLSEPECLARV